MFRVSANKTNLRIDISAIENKMYLMEDIKMSKDWDYSKLAHDAKENGGPEKYLELIRENSERKGILEGREEGRNIGKNEGRLEGLLGSLILDAIIVGGAFAVKKIRTNLKSKSEKRIIKDQEKEVEEAASELIDGMNAVLDEEAINNDDNTVELK